MLEGRRHFEDLIDAARKGSRWALQQLALESTPYVIEALWEIEPPTAVKVANQPEKVRRPWSLWRSGQPLPTDAVAYISRVVRRRAEELRILHGEPNELSWMDRCELEVDHDAVKHMSRLKPWKRGEREHGEDKRRVEATQEGTDVLLLKLLDTMLDGKELRFVHMISAGHSKAAACREAGMTDSAGKALLARIRRTISP